MLFQWEFLYRQVRITGSVKKVSREESVILYNRSSREEKLYFQSSSQDNHPYNQSNVIPQHEIDAYKEYQSNVKHLYGEAVDGTKDENGNWLKMPHDAPELWGGFCLVPNMIEFLDINAKPGTPRRFGFIFEDAKWKTKLLSL